ncbi:MAG: type II toxin-antitoxin system RelB/DinJ family antitoxin [Candidatus Liptonbacteria bacterium]|nr:type II toxin-antitoxin system RelB/DinJ family antitoxin [Candidatus Liptonbacteria bacterium]
MSKTILNIKTDREVKAAAKKIAAELGLPLSVIVNAQLKDFIRNRAVNFSAVPRMSRGLELLLGRMETDIVRKHNLSPIFSSAEEALEYLDDR